MAEVELPNRKTNDDDSSDSSDGDDEGAEVPKTKRPVDGENKKSEPGQGGNRGGDGGGGGGSDDSDSDDSGDGSGGSDDSDASDADSSGGEEGEAKTAGDKAKKKKKKKEKEKRKKKSEKDKKKKKQRDASDDGRRQLRRSHNGPYSRDAPWRRFKLSSLFATVFIFITTVVCFQWNCLFARMCFVTEDPAVPQPQSFWIVPVLAVALVVALVSHLLTMSEAQNGLTVCGLFLFGWAIFVFVISIMSISAAEAGVSATAAKQAWASSPFESSVIRNYYADEEALRVKLVANLNAVGGCGIAISLLQLWHGLNCIIFGCSLLRAY
jgi:hypothetical protein